MKKVAKEKLEETDASQCIKPPFEQELEDLVNSLYEEKHKDGKHTSSHSTSGDELLDRAFSIGLKKNFKK